MECVLLVTMLRVEKAELTSQAIGLIPAKQIEHYAHLLRYILQEELRHDYSVEMILSKSPRVSLKLCMDDVHRQATNHEKYAQQKLAPS